MSENNKPSPSVRFGSLDYLTDALDILEQGPFPFILIATTSQEESFVATTFTEEDLRDGVENGAINEIIKHSIHWEDDDDLETEIDD